MDTTCVIDVDASDFSAKVLEASRSTPVLVDFWAGWCGPCKALTPVLERIANEANGQFVLAKVDTDANRELAVANGIRSLPTVRLFVDGQVVAEFMGAQPESAVREFLRQYVPAAGDGELRPIAELLDSGALDEAEQRLNALAERIKESPQAQSLSARLALLRSAADVPSAEALRARVDRDPGDLEAVFQLAVRDAASARYEAAMDGFLAVLSRDRSFRDGLARRAMIQVFDVLGPTDPRVSRYRGRLASLLN